MTQGDRTGFVEPGAYDDGCLRVEYETYYAACTGSPLYNLTPKEFLLLARLVREIGRPVKFAALWAAGWGESTAYDEHAANSLKTQISTLRRKLRPFGVHILSKKGIGYLLTDAECICLGDAARRS